MKKLMLILIGVICLGISSNAQTLQKINYNDGKILAYIESATAITSFGQRRKSDRLVIENISNSEVTVHYSYRSIRNDHNDNFAIDEIKQKKATIPPGKKHVEGGYLTNGKAGYFFVDSFAIMNVSGGDNSNYGTTSQNNMVPSWLIGTWNGPDGYLFTVTNDKIQWHDGGIGDYAMVDGETVFFKWRHSGYVCKITQTPSGVLYHNPSTGNAYIVNRR